jgi:protein O-mannosyl-transferase
MLSSERMSSARQTERWSYVGLAILAFAIYAGTLRNGFVSDDRSQLSDNPGVTDYHNLPALFQHDVRAFQADQKERSNYYRPIQFVVYMALYYAAGFSAFWFHLLQIAIHAANTLLLFHLARSLLREPAALVAGALFAVHPIHTEAVDWVAALPDILMTLLTLVILCLFVSQQASPRKWQIAVHAILFLLALLVKEPAAAIPALLAGYEWLYLGRGWRELRKNLAFYATLTAVFVVYLAMRRHALGGLVPINHPKLIGVQWIFGPVTLAAEYAGKLILPIDLCSYHSFTAPDSMSALVLISFVVIAAMAAGIFLWRVRAPLVSYGLLVILVPILPVLNPGLIIGAGLAERYLYLPSVGFVLIVGWAWTMLWQRQRKIAWVAAIVVVAVGSLAVVKRAPDWHDDISLLQAAVRQYPESRPLRNELAKRLSQMQSR